MNVELKVIAAQLNGYVRTSARGVPHVVVSHKNKGYSICYFKKSDIFRVFFPYPNEIQTKTDFKTSSEVVEFILKS